MSNYKLYMGGYRGIQGVVIAVDPAEAEVKLYEKLSLGSLPCELEEIELPDYIIVSRNDQERMNKQYGKSMTQTYKKPKK